MQLSMREFVSRNVNAFVSGTVYTREDDGVRLHASWKTMRVTDDRKGV